MSVSPSVRSIDLLVAELRAAGCVFAEDEAQLLIEAATDESELEVMVRRRVAGSPLEYVVGWAEFSGFRISVERGVFVPRRRTQLLAAEAASRTRPRNVVVELCCGSGAICVALQRAATDLRLYAVDIDAVAVRCARRNLGTRAQVFEGDLFAPLPGDLRGTVDVLVANAPYVPTDHIALLPAEAREHEPRIALDGGADGLDLQRRIIAAAPQWLTSQGRLLVETSSHQASRTEDLMADQGLSVCVSRSRELDATVVIGTKP